MLIVAVSAFAPEIVEPRAADQENDDDDDGDKKRYAKM
jgi:hypothetical protein